MSPVGFEPTTSAGERPQTYALDRAATGTGIHTSFNPYPANVKNRVLRKIFGPKRDEVRGNGENYVVGSLTLRRLMSYIYIYGAPILDVCRSHTTTQHSR